mgnify:CR=1 FL=1
MKPREDLLAFACPSCGHESRNCLGRQCPKCPHKGDWIQPGMTELYTAQPWPDGAFEAIEKGTRGNEP